MAPFAHFVDRRLRPALSGLDVSPGRVSRIRRLAQLSVGVLVLLLALWGAGLSLTRPLFVLGDQLVTPYRIGIFLVGLAIAEGLSRLVGYLLERRSPWLEADQRPAVAQLARWGILVVLGVSLLGWLGFNVRSPLLTVREQGVSLFQLSVFCVYVSAVLIGSRVLGSLTEGRLLGRTRLNPGARYAIGRITNYAVLVLGLATSLELLGIQLGSLTVLLGAVGVGIGFGLQNVVNNFVSGLLLLVERPLQIGDMVEVEGSRGRVTRIGGRSTTVRTAENIAIVIPNGDLIAHKLTNWTQADPKVRIGVTLRLDVGTDVEELRGHLLELAHHHPKVLAKPEPQVAMKKFDETGIDLELQVWIDTVSTAPAGVISDLNFGCYRLFRDHGFEVPQTNVNINGAALADTSRP